MEATHSAETLVCFQQTTWHYIHLTELFLKIAAATSNPTCYLKALVKKSRENK
jgi:hypothetical protein